MFEGGSELPINKLYVGVMVAWLLISLGLLAAGSVVIWLGTEEKYNNTPPPDTSGNTSTVIDPKAVLKTDTKDSGDSSTLFYATGVSLIGAGIVSLAALLYEHNKLDYYDQSSFQD